MVPTHSASCGETSLGPWVAGYPVILCSSQRPCTLLFHAANTRAALHGCHSHLGWDTKTYEVRHQWFRAVLRYASLTAQHMENLGAVGLQESGLDIDLFSWEEPSTHTPPDSLGWALRQLIRTLAASTVHVSFVHNPLFSWWPCWDWAQNTSFLLSVTKWIEDGGLETWLVSQSGEIDLYVIIRWE